MDGYSQALVLYAVIGCAMSGLGFWMAARIRRLDANIRRLEGLQAEERAAARAHPAE